MWILLAFLALPFIEIALFIQIGGAIGLWPTLGLVIVAAVLGLSIMRSQGLSALGRLRAGLAAGEDPSRPIADAGMIMLAGLLLLIPGFFTDALGLALLIPPVRVALLRRVGAGLRTQSFVFMRGAPGARRPQAADVIEGDYQVLDDVPPSQRGASGWTRGRS